MYKSSQSHQRTNLVADAVVLLLIATILADFRAVRVAAAAASRRGVGLVIVVVVVFKLLHNDGVSNGQDLRVDQ